MFVASSCLINFQTFQRKKMKPLQNKKQGVQPLNQNIKSIKNNK